MSIFNSGLYKIDMTALSNGISAATTMGDFIEHNVTPEFRKIFPACEYVELVQDDCKYPGIILPDYLGNIGSGMNSCLSFDCLTTGSIYDTSLSVKQGYMEKSTGKFYVRYWGWHQFHSSSEGPETSNGAVFYSYYVENMAICIQVTDNNELGYQFGITQSNRSEASSIIQVYQNHMVTHMTDINTGKQIPVSLILPNCLRDTALTYGYFTDSVANFVSMGRWPLPTKTHAINMYNFNDGSVCSDSLYVCFPESHVSLQNFVAPRSSMPDDGWCTNAVTIGQQKFYLHYSSNNVDNGNSDIAIAKKGTYE